jgi:hypothetical protein
VHGEVCFVGVAGVEGFERLDRSGVAAFTVFGFVDDGRRQAIADST